jgi:uncharacterized protein (TIGR00106 family)
MALMEISVFPIGNGTSLSKYVAKAVHALEGEPGIDYELTSMGTIVQGDVDRLLEVALKLHNAVLATGAKRISTTIKIDDRRDKPVTLTSKLTSLKKALGERD